MNTFKNHVKKFVEVSEEELNAVVSFFQEVEVNKKENILTDGEISKFNFFVLKGCLRKFFINEKGTEQTTQFAIEQWWIADTFHFERQQPADCFIQAVEKSILLKIDYQSQQRLLQMHPVMERYFRIMYQYAYAAAERRIRYLYEYSREESYHHFSALYPAFIQRIPQYLIASYLGFTPEYLSEIRAKLRS